MHVDIAFVVLSMLFQADPKPAGAAPEKPAQAAPPQAAPQEDWRVLTLGKSRLTFYGFLRLDFVFDTGRPDSIQIPRYILSKDSASAAEAGAAGKHDYSIHPRLTRLGLDFDGPTIADLGGAKITGKLETDFYNLTGGTTSSNSREFIRMRHAYGKLDWGTFSILFGQREDVASPLTPTPNNDIVMWDAGNTGDRRPQFRTELKWEGLTFTTAVGVTGAEDGQNLDAAAPNGFFDGESGTPTFQARLGYDMDGWVEKKKISLGIWGHTAQEHLDVQGAFLKDRFTSAMAGFDLTIWLMERVWLKVEGWSGKNLDDVRGGIIQGVLNSHEIRTHGGWVELGVQPLSWWTVIPGFSFDDPRRTYLPAAGRDKNVIVYLCNRLRFGPFDIGVDYLHWVTEYTPGAGGARTRDGRDERLNIFVAYNF